MDPNQNVGAAAQSPVSAPENVMAQGASAKKSNKGMILGMVLLALLAIGGIGFGVWAYMDGNAQKDNLNSQITDLKAQNAKLLEQIGGDEEIIDEDNLDADTAKYIYVGEWGLKIKIPETLNNVSYIVSNWNHENTAGTSLCVTGASTGHNGSPSFVNSMLYGGAYVCLGKNTKSVNEGDGGIWTESVPVGEFYIQGPQAIAGDESDKDWEVESVEIIETMLSDENNRSAI